MTHARARCWIHEDCLADLELSIACGPNPPDMQMLGEWAIDDSDGSVDGSVDSLGDSGGDGGGGNGWGGYGWGGFVNGDGWGGHWGDGGGSGGGLVNGGQA